MTIGLDCKVIHELSKKDIFRMLREWNKHLNDSSKLNKNSLAKDKLLYEERINDKTVTSLYSINLDYI